MKSPFKFLDSYNKDDREIFFGREREIEELYHRVFESKIMLVYGVSGTGKSSLIHCGLANKFSETDWLPLVIRRGSNIINSMAGAIQSALLTKQAGQLTSPVQFKKSVKSLYLDHYKPVYFIFDQFEELFIFGDKEERNAFVQIIKTLVESDLQCRLIFVMREEYMAGITEFEKYIPTFFSNRVRIEKMSHVNAIEAIIGPCRSANITLEEGFSEALLQKLSPDGAEVELTYLQVFLDKIFRLTTGSLPPPGGESKGGLSLFFTLSLLSRIGNVFDLLGSFLDEQISLLSDPDSALAVLKSFVSVKGTKRQMTSGEVKEYAQTLGKIAEESAIIEMLHTFIHLRILKDKDQNERFELRHDALASKIYEKITIVEKEILEIRQFIDSAWNNWQNRKVLISGTDLEYIAPYESRLYLPEVLRTIIEKSKEALLRSKRRRRYFTVSASVILLLVFTGFTLWALNERKKAVEQSKRAENQSNIAMHARDSAIAAQNHADRSRQEAILAKDDAVLQKALADSALIVAENQKKISEQQRQRAENLYIETNNQRLIATEALKAKIIAENRLEDIARDFVMSATMMNILYKGIKNPIKFAIPGYQSGRIYFKLDQSASIYQEQEIFYIVPNKTGMLNITLFRIQEKDTTELGSRSFQVKYLPSPMPLVEGKNSGYILRDSLINTDGIQIVNSDIDTNIIYKVIEYRVSGTSGGSGKTFFTVWVTKNNISKELRKLFSQIEHNQQVRFEGIRVMGPDSLVRNLGSINLRVLEKESWDDYNIFNNQIRDLIYQKNWKELEIFVSDNVEKYYIDSYQVLNIEAYYFYLYINDTTALNKALKWAERAVSLYKDHPDFMDTYASLLFKLGNLDEAEKIQLEAIRIAKSRNKPTEVYENLLIKIRNSR